jgi:hypothetical protein
MRKRWSLRCQDALIYVNSLAAFEEFKRFRITIGRCGIASRFGMRSEILLLPMLISIFASDLNAVRRWESGAVLDFDPICLMADIGRWLWL